MTTQVTDPQAQNQKVTIGNYIALLFAIAFFSGLFRSAEWYGVFDFTTLNGSFGRMVSSVNETEAGVSTGMTIFRGVGGDGARDGFLQALTLIPTVMFALGVFHILETYGALNAARQLLSPLLRPLMALPGHAGLALIASLQSGDAGAALTRQLKDQGNLTKQEADVFTMFQFSAGATFINFFSTGALLYTLTDASGAFVIEAPMGVAILVMLLFKVIGANLFRVYVRITDGKNEEKKAS